MQVLEFSANRVSTKSDQNKCFSFEKCSEFKFVDSHVEVQMQSVALGEKLFQI